MTKDHMFLDELNDKSKDYKVKVKVVEKGRPKTSPHKKKIVYQSLVLQDEKGNKMRGALFGDQVDGYKEVMVYNGVYEISNAPLNPCDPRWRSDPAKVDFQMTFGRKTIIQPMEIETRPVYPEYCPMFQIPKIGSGDQKFDVVGVVLYVEEHAREVTMAQNRELLVREIVIADHSSDHPLTISAWNDLAEAECDALCPWSTNFAVVGFTALRVSGHKESRIRFASTYSRLPTPNYDCRALLHKSALAEMRSRVLAIRHPSQDTQIITIAELRQKKIKTTLQEERQWIKVNVPQAELAMVHAYIGCSRCGMKNEAPSGHAIECVSCKKPECITTPKMSFACEVSDGTGTLIVTAFNEEAGKLFRLTTADIYKMVHSDDEGWFAVIADR